MINENIGIKLNEKSAELKKWFKDLNATLEQWKFSIEDTKEGIRAELHTVVLIKHAKDKK